jgi:hypothetical protein
MERKEIEALMNLFLITVAHKNQRNIILISFKK